MTHETRRVFGWKRPQTLIRATTLLVMAFAIGLVAGPSTAEASDERDQSTKRARAAQESQRISLADTKLIIEHNATDEDTGFQVFVDGEPWNLLTIEGPDERTLLEVRPRGALRTLGLTRRRRTKSWIPAIPSSDGIRSRSRLRDHPSTSWATR
jgi:hypothetical protein